MIRSWSLTSAAVLVLLASMLPWFRTRFAVNDGYASRAATAWEASTWWSIAVLACLGAAAVGVFGAAGQRWALRPAVRWTAAAVAGAAVLLTVVTWNSIPSLDTGHHGFGWSSADASAHSVGDIIRDHLVTVHRNGLTQQVAWGLYAGLASMVLLTAVLVVNATRAPRQR